MSEYIKLVDMSKCTGCRACQVACKQWHGLPAEKTGFSPTLQNPQDFSFVTWNVVRFDEREKDGKINWFMRHDACMHCEDPACVKVCPTGSMIKTEEGAVVHNEKTCIGCKACISACPFDVPRYSKVKDKIAKCDLCYDRITDGEKPACVTACNTGCLDFGPKDMMLAKAASRAKQINGTIYPNNPSYQTSVLYVLPADVTSAELSHTNPNPKMPTTVLWWKNLFRPFTLIGMGGVAGAAMLHYLTKGGHQVDQEDKGGQADDE